ncbi:MAG: hypothetical protein JEY99_02040 [Spirochaetales bacterium]|nr:hypothetical protein [Spirochaetales bacterium]
MVKAEINKRTPLRIFEKSIHGGVGKGNVGVLASRKGVGKTACLVHIATDKLFRGRHIIHVSFSSKVDHIVTWYEDIFKEIAKKRNLEAAVEVHDEIIKNRVIMNFNQKGISSESILKSLSSMISEGGFKADCIVIDGYDLSLAESGDLEAIRQFAKELDLEIWISLSLKGEEPIFDDNGYPIELKEFTDSLEVIVTLKYEGDHVKLSVVKDHEELNPKDMDLKLDTKTLLIAEL